MVNCLAMQLEMEEGGRREQEGTAAPTFYLPLQSETYQVYMTVSVLDAAHEGR